MDHEDKKEGEILDGKTSHIRNYSSEIEILPEDEADHGNVAVNELKHHEPASARGKPVSVRTKWGY
jgi:vacuolar protein sorting-associated protein IST1